MINCNFSLEEVILKSQVVGFLKRPWLCSEWNTNVLLTKHWKVYTVNCLLFFKDDRHYSESTNTVVIGRHCL